MYVCVRRRTGSCNIQKTPELLGATSLACAGIEVSAPSHLVTANGKTTTITALLPLSSSSCSATSSSPSRLSLSSCSIVSPLPHLLCHLSSICIPLPIGCHPFVSPPPTAFLPSFLSFFVASPYLFFLLIVQPFSALRLPVCSLISSCFSVLSLDPEGNSNVAVCCHYFTDQRTEIDCGLAEKCYHSSYRIVHLCGSFTAIKGCGALCTV